MLKFKLFMLMWQLGTTLLIGSAIPVQILNIYFITIHGLWFYQCSAVCSGHFLVRLVTSPSLSASISWFWFSDAQAEPNQKLRVLAAVFLKMQTIVCLSAFAIHMQLHTLILKWFESEQILLFEPLFCTQTFEYFILAISKTNTQY